jgi:glycosyltransferase involved in cell wall biosynthesis
MTPLRVLIKGPFSVFSGYGNDSIGMAKALVDWGCDVYLQPQWVDTPVPKDIALLLAKPLVAPFDVIINHWDPDHLLLSKEAAGTATVSVAWSMWEFSRARPLARRSSSFARRLGVFDLLLMYDQVGLDAWAEHLPKTLPRAVLQGGYDSSLWSYTERDWFGERFMFIMHGQLHNRKCPYTAIQAFNELKHDAPEEFGGARLALHTNIADPMPAIAQFIPGMKVFYETWDLPTLRSFYRAGHCLLAPSRGEGKNLPALEMQSTGGVVAATNWGGMTQWLHPEYAYPLEFELAPTDMRHPGLAQDAKVSVPHLKEVIWHIFTHREEARKKGELASRMIPQMCDWAVVVENLWRRLRDNVPGKGEEVFVKAQQCRRDPGERKPASADAWAPAGL